MRHGSHCVAGPRVTCGQLSRVPDAATDSRAAKAGFKTRLSGRHEYRSPRWRPPFRWPHMAFSLGRKKTTVGLDIGSGLVKIAVIDHSKKEPELVRVAVAPLADDAIVEGEVMDPN